MINRIFVLTLLVFPLWAGAQVKVKGNVKSNTAPVGWANVVLIGDQGKMVSGNITKEDGSFELTTKKGPYKIRISFLGFINWEKDIVLEKDTDMGVIILRENEDMLKEVSIVAKKQLVTYKTDRLVFDVESSVSANGGNAVNAISAAPGVVVQNNAISMLGKGSSRVMVDGRIIELTGEDLMSYLKSISSGDIKNIEVISNPPAKYEAGGDGGLININLKKGGKNSWKNTTTVSYDQTAYSAYTLRNNFLYNKNKVRFALSAGGKLGNSKVNQNLDTYYPNGPWELRYEGKQKEDNSSGRVALDYDLSARTSVGLQYLRNTNQPGSTDYTVMNIRNTNNSIDSLLVNTGLRDLSSDGHAYNAHLLSTLDTLNRKLSFDLDYFTFNTKTDNNFIAKTFLPDMGFLNINQSARNSSDQQVKNYSAKMDMEHPLKFVNLSYGARVSFVNSNARIQYYNTATRTQVLDPDRSNEFDYKENNQAVYVNGIKNMGTKFSLQLGLRIENTRTKGYSATLDETNTNNYLKLFPTLYASYKENDNNSFLFNYGKRINRPGFGILNPFRSYINSNSYSEGNPFLKPSFSDNFDFTHVYKGVLRTNVFMNITTDGYGPVFTSDPTNNTLIITRQNYFKEYYYGIGENYTADITSWWQSQYSIYLLASKSKFTDQITANPQNGAQLYLSTNNTFSLSKATKLQVDYMYSSRFKKGLYEIGYMSGLNIAVKQNLFKNSAQLSLMANDIFNTAYLKNYTSIVNGIKQVYSENNSSRFFRLSLTYNFGNNKINVKQRGMGNDEERKRTN